MTDESGSPRRPAWRSPSRSSPAASSPRSRPRAQTRALVDGRLNTTCEPDGIGRPHADARLVPAPLLDGPPEGSKRGHHLGGRGLVHRPVERKEDRIGALAQRGAQRHAGVDARTPSPRTTPSPRPDAAVWGRHRHRRRPADHRAPVASAPRLRRGTGRGRRAGPTRVPRRREAAAGRASTPFFSALDSLGQGAQRWVDREAPSTGRARRSW